MELYLAELKECGGPLLLLLLSMDILHRDVDVVEQLSVELDSITTAEEHHHLWELYES